MKKRTNKQNKSVDPKEACASKKMCFDSVPHTLLMLAAAGSESGAKKYGRHNWLSLEDNSLSVSTYLNAALRHLLLYRAGQDLTSDTQVHNLDSIIVGLSILRDAMIFNKVSDDRSKLTKEQLETYEAILNNNDDRFI